MLSPDVRKGPWTAAEDEIVRELVLKATVEKVKWREVAAHLPGRLGKQCRERWYVLGPRNPPRLTPLEP